MSATATKSKKSKQPSPAVATCRVCGCTDADCSQCIKKTGIPCHWVEPDLCSACAPKPVRDAAAIAADIAKVKWRAYEHSGVVDCDEEARLPALQVELDIALAKEVPMPAQVMAAPKYSEDDVNITYIDITGNHREIMHEADTIRLARTLNEMGLLQRIGVRARSHDKNCRLELIYGSRRLAAAKYNRWPAIPAKIYPPETTNDQVEMIRTVENLQRAELSPSERALAIARMIDSVNEQLNKVNLEPGPIELAVSAAGTVEAYVGQLLGFPAAWVRDHGYVSRLGPVARQLLSENRITLGHARELAKLATPKDTDDIADEVSLRANRTGGRDVEYTRKRVQERLCSLKIVPWRLDVRFGLLNEACQSCPHNTKNQPLLFEHDSPETVEAINAVAGTCMHQDCFITKEEESKKLIEKSIAQFAGQNGAPITTKKYVDEGWVPKEIRPKTFSRAVAKEMAPDAKKPSSSSSSSGSSSVRSPIDVADDEYKKARDAWAEDIVGKIFPKLQKTPGAIAMFTLVDQTPVDEFMGCPYMHRQYKESDEAYLKRTRADRTNWDKKAADKRVAPTVRMLVKPTWADLVKLEKAITGQIHLSNYGDQVLLMMAKELGIKHEDAPDREAFLSPAIAKLEKTAAAAKGKKK